MGDIGRDTQQEAPSEGANLGKRPMFKQILDPTGNLFVTWLVALIPVVLLLFLLAGLRLSAWSQY